MANFGLVSPPSEGTQILWGLELDGGHVDLFFLGEDDERIYIARINHESGELERFEGDGSSIDGQCAAFLALDTDGSITVADGAI